MIRTSFLIATVAIAQLAWGASGPLSTLKQKNDELDRLLHQKPPAGSIAERRQRDEIKALAAALLDYQELARRSLSDHWEKLTSSQRSEFVSTLRELIERNYVKQLRSDLNYAVTYTDEKVQGDDASVATVVKVKTEGKTTDADIVYKLARRGGAWRVYDIVTDEVSLVRNYRSQFEKIITEKSYDELLRRMKAKIAEGN